MAKQKDVLLNHDYDGIQELDNDMPSWWLWLFYFSIIFSVLYMLHYHVLGTGKSAAAKYEIAMNPNQHAEQPKKPHIGGLRYHSPFYSPKADVTPRIEKLFSSYIGPDIEFADLVQEAMKRADAAGLAKLQEAFPDLYAELGQRGTQIKPRESAAPAAKAEESDAKTYDRLTDAESLAAGKDIYVKIASPATGKTAKAASGPI